MVYLIGALVGAGLLYFWLCGHWFARVVSFLLFAVLLGFIGACMTGMLGPQEHNNGWVGMLLGFAAAWPVSGIPVYVRRYGV